MNFVSDNRDKDFLSQLHRMGEADIQEICNALQITATAVRQRLVRLEAQTLVSRDLVRSGRGRPRHVYRVTDEGRRQLGDNYASLARILWREIRNIEDSEVRSGILQRIRRSLVASYGRQVDAADPIDDRLQQLQRELVGSGFDVEVDRSGVLPIIRENNCPYLDLAAADPGICELEHAVFEEVLGVQVHLKQRCVDGHSCCEFEVASKPVAG